MTYKGSEINKQNLDPTLQQEISNATNKANNSWQMNKYNATSSMNLGDVTYSKSFQLHVSDWKSTSNTEILSIVFPTLVTFSGIIKLTASSNWNNTDAGGGVTVEYTTQLYSGTIHKYSKTIISVSPTFAKNYYLEDLVLDNTEKHLIIPIFKAPTANNSLYIEVSIVGINIPNDIMSKAHLVTSDAGSPTSLGYPWTPQTTSFMQKNQDNAISGSITSRNTFPFILKPDGMRAHMFHKDANGSLYIAPTDENGNAEWGLGTVFSLDGTVYMPKLMVDGVDLKQSVSNGKAQVASAITGKGVQTASDATFETMANNIRAIPTGNNVKTYISTVIVPAVGAGLNTSVVVTTTFKPTDAILNLDGRVLLNGVVQGNSWANRHSVFDVRVVDAGGGRWSTLFDIRGGSLGAGEQMNAVILVSYL